MAPTSSGISSLASTEIDNEENKMRADQNDYPSYTCTDACFDPCDTLCELIRFW